LHTHDAGFLGLQALRLSRKTDLPLLATCYFVPRFVAHYVTWDGEPHEAIESITWAYSEWLFNRFDHVVFATYAHRQAFLAKGLEVPTSIISNGLDIERYSPGPGNTRVAERYALPPGRRILFVSRIAQDKRIEILIEAMTRVSAELEAHLLIVGRGDDRPRLEEMVAEKGLKDWVHFMGFVPEGDMPALYRLADCFAITSTCEVQSLPTLQAVATGLPVVAADAMALPELVHDGENGYLVPPEDPMATASALLKILQQPALAASMKQAGRRIAQAHDESRTFDQYEQLYYRMADQGEMASWLGPAAKVSRQRDHA
jgi:glycosyltransferase involved in cell wall biosynthesis